MHTAAIHNRDKMAQAAISPIRALSQKVEIVVQTDSLEAQLR
jgi:hypothetical protein